MSRNKDEIEAWVEDFDDSVFTVEDDAIIETLGALIEKSESVTSVLNLETLLKIKKVYGFMSKEFARTDVRVTYGLHDPYPSMGFVELEGNSIAFKNTDVLRKCMELASNTECYSLTKHAARLIFTFHRLTKPIE